MTTGAPTRASDADRQRVVEILQEQTARGRLTLQEFQDRADAAYRARTWQELSTLTEDLPVHVTFDRQGGYPTVSRPPAAEDRAPTDRSFPAREPSRRRLLACCCGPAAS